MQKKEFTQEQKVIEFIKKHGTINRKQAIDHLHIYNLTAVISEMRRKGIDVETIWIKGKTSRYCKYGLSEDAR